MRGRELLTRSREVAEGLAPIDLAAHAATKERIRGRSLDAPREAIEAELAARGTAEQNPAPSGAEIDGAMRENVCGCGTYVRIRAAIKRAAAALWEIALQERPPPGLRTAGWAAAGEEVPCAAMNVLRHRRVSFVLLLAALSQPAWAAAHVAVDQHLAQHHAEAGPRSHSSSHSSEPHAGVRRAGAAPHPHAHEPHADITQLAAPERTHDHAHEHRVAAILRPVRGADSPASHSAASPATLPSAAQTPRLVATRWAIQREAVPSRTGPGASGPSDPRAPPIS